MFELSFGRVAFAVTHFFVGLWLFVGPKRSEPCFSFLWDFCYTFNIVKKKLIVLLTFLVKYLFKKFVSDILPSLTYKKVCIKSSANNSCVEIFKILIL